MSIALASRIQRVKPSATLAVSAKAAELRAAGRNIIGLGAGEPDFDTPEHIKEAAAKAMQDGFTRYTPVDGLASVKQAIIDKFARDNQLNFAANQILVSTGGKQCLYNLCQALLNQGDEVIIPGPYWVSYPDMVLLAEGEPVILQTGFEQGFKITAQQLEAAITPRTRLFFINSPSNPTGQAYTQAELKALAAVLVKHPNIVVATDDMYEHMHWSGEPFANILNVCPELAERTLVFNGVSKAYAMTGWRIGYVGGPAPLIAAMKKIQGQSTSSACAISQKAAEAALNSSQACVHSMVAEYQKRAARVHAGLSDIRGVKCLPAHGTFYLFPDVSEAIAATPGVDDDVAFAAHLLETADLALVPGSAFGAPGCIRLSFVLGINELDDAVARLKSAIETA